MKYDELKWCMKKSRGIKLVEPNGPISQNYLKESTEDFEMIGKSNPKWRTVTSYYACYNALYAILMKVGIKSEIHECTIALMELFGFKRAEIDFIEFLKRKRLNVQYYLKPPDREVNTRKVLEFITKCREIHADMSQAKIDAIRTKLKEVGKG